MHLPCNICYNLSLKPLTNLVMVLLYKLYLFHSSLGIIFWELKSFFWNQWSHGPMLFPPLNIRFVAQGCSNSFGTVPFSKSRLDQSCWSQFLTSLMVPLSLSRVFSTASFKLVPTTSNKRCEQNLSTACDQTCYKLLYSCLFLELRAC